MQQTRQDVQEKAAVNKVGSIATMPTLLRMLQEVSGLGFTAVARVTESTWTVCAVHDSINFGLEVGSQLETSTTLCAEVRKTRLPILVDHASIDPRFKNHLSPKIWGFESLITVPIITADGEYFGSLFGLDFVPRNVSEPWVLKLFDNVAQLVALKLDSALQPLGPVTSHAVSPSGASLNEQFLTAVADDLRKPADAIYDAAHLLEEKSLDPLSRELAVGVKRYARRLAGLANHLHDFVSGGLGQGIDLRIEQSAELDPVLNRVLTECRNTHPQRRIISNIAVRHPVHCDPDRIGQLVSNLLEAALAQAAPTGPVSIAAMFEDAGLSIDVWNAGEPIPAERVSQLFAPAFQSEAAHRPIDSLSLHVCRLIVDAHHGFISVISNRTHGTQFSIWIPVPTAGITSLTAFRRRMAETNVQHLAP